MAGSEVGAVTVEGLDPLVASVVDRVGDHMGDVVVTAPGHGDVRRRGAGRLAEREVRDADSLALSAVGGGGERELDMLVDVLGRERALPGTANDVQAAVVADPGHGPGVTVGDSKVAVVASGGDPVAQTDPLTTARDDITKPLTGLLTGSPAGVVAAAVDRCVERTDLLAGVGDDKLITVGTDGGQGCGAFDLTRMEDDPAALVKLVEDLTRPLTTAVRPGPRRPRRRRPW